MGTLVLFYSKLNLATSGEKNNHNTLLFHTYIRRAVSETMVDPRVVGIRADED